ncbi:MAG TPA: hypothetical protein VFV96_09180 [Verrucomicrobiae bacterium]|nr:hypothetical protein [Verrucomicrobiae bacterium]
MQILVHYGNIFLELVRTPFEHSALIWGIVPLYFGLLLNELTSDRANFQTALQTGFSFLWAGFQWLYPHLKLRGAAVPRVELGAMLPVNLLVTVLVLGLGLMALVCGLRRRFPRYGTFLGHSRFANYFAIMIFPIQSVLAGHLPWTWDRLIAIALFAVPVWLVLHFGLMPFRR